MSAKMTHAAAGAAIVTQPQLRIIAATAVRLAEVAAWPATEAELRKRLAQFTGIAVPGTPGQSAGGARYRVMMPARGRWMIAADASEALARGLRGAIDARLGAVVDLSAARVGFHLEGRHARDLIAKLVPVDLDLARFGPGCVFQSGATHHIDVLVVREAAERFTLYAESSYWRAIVEKLRAESREFV